MMKHKGKESKENKGIKKSEESKKMFLAFFLNLFFSVFELAGSFVTGSVAIASDALHDLGDAVTIGIFCFLEGKSNRAPDEVYTYGYRRYSVLAGFFGTLMLLIGSLVVIYHAVGRITSPNFIHYDKMIFFGIFGVICNGIAAYVTHGGESVNQKAINLHMAEDVLGWIAVLMGAFVMKVTGFAVIDPLLSIGVAVFILVNAAKNLKRSLEILLEKAPSCSLVSQVRELLLQTDGVLDVHHIHLWSMDGIFNYATLHLVIDKNPHRIKETARDILRELGISHVTLEVETPKEHCHEITCVPAFQKSCHHHHHH